MARRRAAAHPPRHPRGTGQQAKRVRAHFLTRWTPGEHTRPQSVHQELPCPPRSHAFKSPWSRTTTR
ncbi:Uncharacterized protein PA52Ts32_p0002 (plasmid) [Pseudomonas aeruginosa]|nr:Uncharacterized protein PA52Ts32_p0002 [Pseudomonas aeruginosa]